MDSLGREKKDAKCAQTGSMIIAKEHGFTWLQLLSYSYY